MAYASLATGVLLAAGTGSRFDPQGLRNKLLEPLPGGACVAHEAAHRLLLVVPKVIAVVRPGAEALAHALNEAGCDVVFAPDAVRGMGASLAAAVEADTEGESWIVALADMPRIAVPTIEAVARELDAGAPLVAPFHDGRRGHPVGFGLEHRAALIALDGDTGARALLSTQPIKRIDVDDPGILRDVDTPADLHGL
ncbi:NTP transferase domain-containing protein [Paraburkholderia tropica]|uniref:Molybdenum cofactor cytidylyltransferase n=1 Tax=Paraburkholderia tropica TaxID=92647 RepID=A0A1A5X568_9BURK|nr:nucleotidyltransferase family protein [Paraburkholderia tropica]MBB2984074.1 molybdenum cofactor cytidylyltransferase [Paraburkholderia tropica]OBR48552.1 molybdopterin-guanine dinucleotide biosynthesis protein MobA [Paraburkholderia tropica]RQN33920.1 nucleotidyltransferase family protein [Paraburkholderia tropica]SEK14898.1 molybdenum cofactor cytidylyltransferase [Paraburkholderia tropica]